MLPFLRGRSEFFPWLLVGVVLASVSVCAPVNQCPKRTECTRAGRQFCTPGSSECGPCLSTLQENKEGLCVPPDRHQSHHNKKTSLPDLDNEIDYLSQAIAKQRAADTGPPASPPKLQSRLGESQPPSKIVSQFATVKPAPHSPTTSPRQTAKSHQVSGRSKPVIFPRDSLLIIMMSACVFLAFVALVLAAGCWVRLKRESRLAQKADYPVFQAVGSSNFSDGSVSKPTSGIKFGDKKLAQSAQMYHYQHQKQQMLSMEKHKAAPKVSESRAPSDEENDEGDYTVYECPGLAPTGEMEVKNPLFDDSALQPGRNHK